MFLTGAGSIAVMGGKQPDFFWYLLAAIVAFALVELFVAQTQVVTIPYSDFKTLLAAGKVTEATVGQDTIDATVDLRGAEKLLPPAEYKQLDKPIAVTDHPAAAGSPQLHDNEPEGEGDGGLSRGRPRTRRGVAAARGPGQQDIHHSRGIGALGHTQQLPTEDRYLLKRSELLDRLDVLLGGRVAEELVYGDVSTGAQDDLERASRPPAGLRGAASAVTGESFG